LIFTFLFFLVYDRRYLQTPTVKQDNKKASQSQQ